MVYEYRCGHCGHRFDVYATLAEKEAGLSPSCPRCGSADARRLFGRVLFLRRGEAGGDDDTGLPDGGGGWPGHEDLDDFGGADGGVGEETGTGLPEDAADLHETDLDDLDG